MPFRPRTQLVATVRRAWLAVGRVWGVWSALRRRPLPSRYTGARERRGAACTDLLPANSSSFPVKGCSSGRENLARCGCPGWAAASSGQGLGRWRALRRRPLPSRYKGAHERRGAACADLLPADSSRLPVKGCSSGRESGSLRLPGWAGMACAVTAARSAPPAPPAPQEPVPPGEPERGASNELAGLRRKLRRLARRVDVLEGRNRGPLDD